MKKVFLVFLAVISVLIAGCKVVHEGCDFSAAPQLKVGFFVDNGSRGGGVFKIARLLYYAPQLNITMLDGKDIRNGKLDELDLLVIPGGSSATQFKMMRASGAAKIREFVKKGGNCILPFSKKT